MVASPRSSETSAMSPPPFLDDRSWPEGAHSSLRLLRYLEGVVDFNPQVVDGALQFSMAKEKLHRPEVLGLTVDQRRFGPAHGVRPIAGTVESDFAYPAVNDSGVLACRQVWRGARSAREHEVGASKSRRADPCQ